MRRFLALIALGGALCVLWSGPVDGRGFGGGGFRGGSFGGGSFDASRSFSGRGEVRGFGGGSFEGSRSVSGWSGGGFGGASSSYNRSFDGSRGGSIDTSGTRGVDVFPGGAAAGGTRNTTVTGPDGRSYSGSREAGAAVGPYGRTVGGETHTGAYSGPNAAFAGTRSAAGVRFPTDVGLSHYSAFGAAGVAFGHSTAYWSGGVMTTRAAAVRTSFPYYSAFRPAWYTAHPGAWFAAGWAASRAWETPEWSYLASYVGVPPAPSDYDFGSTIVLQDNDVYVDGTDVATAPIYAEQATMMAETGQQAAPPADTQWQPLGVFALVQGQETTSNNIFQLAVDKNGTIRGNYYDGLMDTTTPVYGSVQQSTQRVAWTIGKAKDRVFDAGLYNLTKAETPVLVHLGPDRSQQMFLVRMKQSQLRRRESRRDGRGGIDFCTRGLGKAAEPAGQHRTAEKSHPDVFSRIMPAHIWPTRPCSSPARPASSAGRRRPNFWRAVQRVGCCFRLAIGTACPPRSACGDRWSDISMPKRSTRPCRAARSFRGT